MLSLTRNTGQSIYINGGLIKVKVTSIDGNQVTLAFDAPKHVTINREEVYLKIKEEQQNQVHKE